LNPIKEGNVIEQNQCFWKNQKPSKNRSVKKIEKDGRKEKSCLKISRLWELAG